MLNRFAREPQRSATNTTRAIIGSKRAHLCDKSDAQALAEYDRSVNGRATATATCLGAENRFGISPPKSVSVQLAVVVGWASVSCRSKHNRTVLCFMKDYQRNAARRWRTVFSVGVERRCPDLGSPPRVQRTKTCSEISCSPVWSCSLSWRSLEHMSSCGKCR